MPRIRQATVTRVTAAILLVLLAAVALPRSRAWLRPRLTRAVDVPLRGWRMATARDLPWLDGLAVSQVGYAPAAPRTVTAPAPFARLAVVDHNSGVRIWHSEAAPRAIPAAAITSTASLWVADFTPLRTPGTYHLETDTGLVSFPFRIAADVYDAPIRAVQRVFYLQRAFTAIDAVHAEGPWTHGDDAARAPAGVQHGWHDAGDYSLYNMTAVSSLFWLLEAYHDFRGAGGVAADDTNIPESGNGLPDLLDEARWELDWLLSVQDANGGVRNSTCLESYAAYGHNPVERGPAYVAGEIGTIATARATGILAYAAFTFADLDTAYAARLRAAALRGWQYLAARPSEHSDGPTCPAFREDGDARVGRMVRQFAAAGLLLATGDRQYHDAFATLVEAGDLDDDPSPYRFAVYAALLYGRAGAADPDLIASLRAQLLANAARARAAGAQHPFGFSGRPVWGSLAAGFERTAGLNAQACRLDRTTYRDDCAQALANLDYALGRNGYRVAYISGLPGVTRGRQRAFHHWLATLRATPFLFPGAVAGGPNAAPEAADGSRPHAWPMVWGYWGDPAMPRDGRTPLEARYTDNDSWSTNELDIGWQAVALYHLYFAQWFARLEPAAPAVAADQETTPAAVETAAASRAAK